MIGRSLSERLSLTRLPPERAVALLTEALAVHAKALVEVRAHDAAMVACLILRADKPAVRACKALGIEVKLGGGGVFGIPGASAVALFPAPTEAQREWLEAGCGPRETKVLLVAGGLALIRLETNAGKVSISPGP